MRKVDFCVFAETKKLAIGLRGGHGLRHPTEGLALVFDSEDNWKVTHAAKVLYENSSIFDAGNAEKVEKRIEFF